MAKKELSFAEQAEKDRRAEYASILRHASPEQYGEELDEGSDARKAKLAEAKKGAKDE